MTSAEDLYQRAVDINQDAFNAGLYDAAFHALMTALHCAEWIESDQPLLTVSKLAADQLAWIDQNAPEYDHSSISSKKRGIGKSIYANISTQADMTVKMRNNRRRWNST